MVGRLSTEDALAAIAALAETEPDANIETELRALLTHRSNFVIGKAVHLAQERSIASAGPELIKSFGYFMDDCIKRDPGCSAKLAIVNYLSTFAEPAWDVYLAGVRHVQKEPAWGGPIDTATTLRAMCGRALIAMGHHDAFRWGALLLADPEPMTRALAVETLAGAPDERSELLLRAKIGPRPDPRPAEVREYDGRDPERGIEMSAFDALMKIAPDESFDFVAVFLNDGDPDRLRGAALALGESRKPEAFAALRERWQRLGEHGVREALALPIALLRTDEAFAFLMEELRNAPIEVASALIEGLALFRETPGRTALVKEAVDGRKSRPLAQTFRKAFEDKAQDA